MCCGKNRIQASRPPRTMMAPMQTQRYGGAIFEYVGQSSLIIKGSATGRYYRFDRPGCRIEVDMRDRTSVATMPALRLVRR